MLYVKINSAWTIFNFSHTVDNMKLQIKRYGNDYNLLINGQDFDSFVSHLKTIQEIQEPMTSSLDYRNQKSSKAFRKIETENLKEDTGRGTSSKGDTMFTTMSSARITLNSNVFFIFNLDFF